MTVAVDIKTGKVIGQVTSIDRTDPSWLVILTKDGYQHRQRNGLRLEKVD